MTANETTRNFRVRRLSLPILFTLIALITAAGVLLLGQQLAALYSAPQ